MGRQDLDKRRWPVHERHMLEMWHHFIESQHEDRAMSQCVYTGALVLLVEYDVCVRADLFLLGDQVLIQWGHPGHDNEQVMDRSYEAKQNATHKAIIGHGYHHVWRGITIVPRTRFQGEFK